jgi:hypothetical protein
MWVFPTDEELMIASAISVMSTKAKTNAVTADKYVAESELAGI